MHTQCISNASLAFLSFGQSCIFADYMRCASCVTCKPNLVSAPQPTGLPRLFSPWPHLDKGGRGYHHACCCMQARSIMREMQVGDQAFFYHSSCKQPGVVGIVEVVRAAYPDPTARDPHSKYYDPKDTGSPSKWVLVDVRLVKRLERCVGLEELKRYRERELQDMVLLRQPRLSVQRVTGRQWDFIVHLARTPA